MTRRRSLIRAGRAACLLLLAVLVGSCRSGARSNLLVVHSYEEGAFPLVQPGQAATLYVDPADAEVVRIAADAFAGDVERVAGIRPAVHATTDTPTGVPILIGTLGQSALIDRLADAGKLPMDRFRGSWETFTITLLDRPFEGVEQALVVVGSDRRGTAYGVFELSRRMGVSPWVWWADVRPEPEKELFLTGGTFRDGPPSVMYRGVFLNDEDWGLQPWAAQHMDPDVQDIGPNAYAHIFELLLRLRANYIWPAMHPSTKAFYFYKDNPEVADRYAIVVGSSHAEPMLRNNVFEWTHGFEEEYGRPPGPWRYDTNRDEIFTYWQDRAKEASHFESVFTVGMRGVHDSGMPGPDSKTGKIKLLEQVIADQRGILAAAVGKPADEIPQIFCPYKEVLDLYQGGLVVPDDVTIVWADDNHGYIRQLSTPAEQRRSGGSGVYYHLSYWGSPADYLWLSSTSPSLVSFEMTKAFRYGAQRLWVFNVGDIKPAEMETQFAMDLAWDVEAWPPETAYEYPEAWAAEIFGAEVAPEITEIKRTYYRLAQAGKPEHLAALEFTDEQADERIRDYERIAGEAETIRSRIPDRLQDAYFELILYPVEGARLMNEKVLFARRSLELARQGREVALEYAERATDAYERIQEISRQYNDEIADGKWSGMMSWHPRDLPVFEMPEVATQEMIDAATDADAAMAGDAAVGAEADSMQAAVVISAVDYTKRHAPSHVSIETIPELGPGARGGVTLMPFDAPSVSPENVENAPVLTYEADLEAGNRIVRVKALPGHRIHEGRGLRYAVSVNEDAPQVVDLDAPSESPTWKVNVLRGYAEGETTHNVDTSGTATIRIYLLDPGLVINEIEIL